jgi:hypothetical protein
MNGGRITDGKISVILDIKLINVLCVGGSIESPRLIIAKGTQLGSGATYKIGCAGILDTDGTSVLSTALFENPYYYLIRDVNLKRVTSIQLISGGGGYTSVPTVTIIGGNGNGALATATINNGSVSAITITNSGENYTAVPTVHISGGGGSGALAKADINVTATIVNGVYYSGDIPLGPGGLNIQDTKIITDNPRANMISISGCCNNNQQFDDNPISPTFGTCISNEEE